MIINALHLVSVLNTYYACPFSYLIAFPSTDFTDYLVITLKPEFDYYCFSKFS
jgi:hypothetical protein